MKESFVYGCHVVEAILGRAPERVLSVHFDASRTDARLTVLRDKVASLGLSAEECRKDTLERLVGEEALHQGVVARARPAPTLDEKSLMRVLDEAANPLVLVLDGVQDPRNLGACIRNADAAGAAAVVISRAGAAGLTAVARKAASGAAEWLPLAQVGNLARAMEMMKDKGIWLLGADQDDGRPYNRADMARPVGLVLGAEGAGLRRLTREHCDELVRIPMLGGVGSLNVSVASGILLYEAARQRGIDDG